MTIEFPSAQAIASWREAAAGGRKAGRPTAPVYMATAVFVQGLDVEVQPEWPAMAEQLSVLLQKTAERDDGGWQYEVGFLMPDLAQPYVFAGAKLFIMEGSRVVGSAVVTYVYQRK